MRWTALQMVTRTSAFEWSKEWRAGLRVAFEDASIAFRMPLICSGLLPFPIDPFLSPPKLTLTKCHACLLFSLPSPLEAFLILPLFLLALTPISFPSRLSISRGSRSSQSDTAVWVWMDGRVRRARCLQYPPSLPPSFPARSRLFFKKKSTFLKSRLF